MIHSRIVLAFGLSAFTGMTVAGIMGASAQAIYIDESGYPVPPAYVAPAVPPAYYVAPPGYVAAAPAYTAPAAPLAVVPVAPPAYAAAPAYTAPAAPLAVVPVTPPAYAAAPAYAAPAITPGERVTRHVIVGRRPAYPRYDYGYVTYEEW